MNPILMGFVDCGVAGVPTLTAATKMIVIVTSARRLIRILLVEVRETARSSAPGSRAEL
jgi:hypothetical protein